jgi:hypothetical protein
MPGPVSNGVVQDKTNPLTKQNIKTNGKTSTDWNSGKHARHDSNKGACAIRMGGGKFKGTHNCHSHKGK